MISEDHTLAHILENNPLPVLIQFSESKDIPTEGRNKEGKPYQFLITHVYEEVFIQGNFITDGKSQTVERRNHSIPLSFLVSCCHYV